MECLDEGKKREAKARASIVSSLRQNFRLEHLLKAAHLARSTYFYHEARKAVSGKYCELKQHISTIFDRHKGRYGYRRITLALKQMGISINHKLTMKLMKALGIKSNVRPKKYRAYKGGIGKIADNILNRNFVANEPNAKWVTDVTEFNVRGEKLYLSPVMDLFNGEIVAHSTNTRPSYDVVKNMLDGAIKLLKPHEKPILHSDQGWQYQMPQFQEKLKKSGIIQSMSRKGNCLDNAAIESFFAILKTEMFYGHKFDSVDELAIEINDYINYYNNDRIKTKLNGLSPTHFRMGLNLNFV